MNAPSITLRPTAAPPAPAPARADAREQRQRGDQFERLLRDKAAARDEPRDADSTTRARDLDGVTDALSAVLPPPPPPPGPVNTPTPLPAATTSIDAMRSAAVAAPDTKLNAASAAIALPADAGTTATAWQVSLREPLGVAIELRATRSAEAAPWSLTIASAAPEAALLARRAPRLDERLRSRAVTHTHVRIEGDDGETT